MNLIDVPCVGPRFNLIIIPREQPEGILLTGGIGDVFAVQSYFPPEWKQTLRKVYYATPAAAEASTLLSEAYPQAEHAILYGDKQYFRNKGCPFYRKEELVHIDCPDWEDVEDCSIIPMFEQIERGYYRYTGSHYIQNQTDDLSRIELPAKYVVLQPDSQNASPNRNFTAKDWETTIGFLHRNGLKGVILRQCSYESSPLPRDTALIDLSNATTLFESIEILKLAKGYIGIDSCISVLASKLYQDHLCVKSVNPHFYRWQEVYLAPRTQFSFVKHEINKI